MHIGSISHPHPIADKKVKYFHDWFHYWLNNSAWKLDGFPDSHLSLLQRILFRLERLQTIPPSTLQVINLYLDAPLFDLKQDPFSKVGAWSEKLKELKLQFQNIPAKQIDVRECRSIVLEIILALNGPEGLRGFSYFELILNEIISFLTCEHDLSEHSNEIAYCAKLLAAEYLRVGFDAKDLQGINGAFSTMLSRKSKNSDHTNKFRAQFEELLHIYRGEKEEDFLFRIDNIRAPVGFHFEHCGVRLSTFQSLDYDQLRWGDSLTKAFKEHFSAQDSVVAIVPLRFKSFEEAKRRSLFLIRQALGALRYVSDKMEGVINQKGIYRIKGKDLTAHWESNISQIGQITMDLLNENNFAIPMPSTPHDAILRQIERTDNIFFRALSEDFQDDAILHFWRYWEAIFSSSAYKEGKNGPKIIHDLSRILSLNQANSSQVTLGNYIYNCAINASMNTNPNVVGLSYEFCVSFEVAGNDYSDFIELVKNATDYPFLKKQIKRYCGITQDKEAIRMQRFYSVLLWELYEQRNFVMHEGIYCEQTIERLHFFIQRIINQWRSLLFQEVEQNLDNSLDATIENLIAKVKTHYP